jgi:spoIIIJ-associated protein
MRSVETTGKTIEEAKSIALDQLGVAEDDAEFEVLEEPSAGLFGRVRGEARVKAWVRPSTPRGKTERGGDRRRSSNTRSPKNGNGNGRRPRNGERSNGERSERGDRPARAPRAERPERNDEDRPPREPVDPNLVTAAAADFLQGLVTAFGVTADVKIDRNEDEIDARVDGEELGLMVGPRGNTLLAIQDLTRVASQRRLGDQETRLRIDIAGYRERRREALSRFALKVAEDVKATGEARVLEPMPSADRKVVHDTLVEVEGVQTRSEGEDPRRRIVVEPAEA